jgi:hypothetical protein
MTVEDLERTLKELGFGLSRLLSYLYGGFLFIVLVGVVEGEWTERIIKEIPWEVTALGVIAIGSAVYIVHRSVIIPVHHLLGTCGLFVWDILFGRLKMEDSFSPTRWLKSFRVKFGSRIMAYSTLRHSREFLQEKEEREGLDIRHAEHGLVVMTFEGLLLAGLYFRRMHPGTLVLGDLRLYKVLLCLSVLFLILSYFGPLPQHMAECMRWRKKRDDVKKTLEVNGFVD